MSDDASDQKPSAGDAGADGKDAANTPIPGEPAAVRPDAPESVSPAAVPVSAMVTTLAGNNTRGYAEGSGVGAKFFGPRAGVNAAGTVYVADSFNHRIRQVTAAGVVTTFAGSGTVGLTDGIGVAARFNVPIGVAIDSNGNLYIADNGNHAIRKVTSAGVVTTLAGSTTAGSADGSGASASFNTPGGLAVDASGNVYVADSYNHLIRKVTPAGIVTTIAGSGAGSGTATGAFADGTGAAASFSLPAGVALDSAGDIYVADYNNQRIRKVTSAGVVTTLAGSGTASFADGTGAAAGFRFPIGIAVGPGGNIYVADNGNNRVRRVTSTGAVTTLAGSDTSGFADGTAATATFASTGSIAPAADGKIYVGTDSNIRTITAEGIGQLAVVWSAPGSPGTSAITSYTATARAAGQPDGTCKASGATSCVIRGLMSGVSYTVSVTATSSAGTSPSSASGSAIPN